MAMQMQGLGAGARPSGTQIPEANYGAGGGGMGGLGEGSLQQASPEEQKVYDSFVSLYRIALFDEKMMPKTLEFLGKAPDIIDAIAEVTASIALRVYSFAREKGMEIPGDMLVVLGKDELIPQTVELVEEAGIAELTEEDMEAALYLATDKFKAGAMELGTYGQELMAQDKQALDQMADSGKLDAMLSQLEGMRSNEGEMA